MGVPLFCIFCHHYWYAASALVSMSEAKSSPTRPFTYPALKPALNTSSKICFVAMIPAFLIHTPGFALRRGFAFFFNPAAQPTRSLGSYNFPQKANVTAPIRNRNETA